MIERLTVAQRLASGFGFTVAIGLAIVGYTAFTMKGLSASVHELARNRMVKVAQFTEVKGNCQSIARLARNIVISIDPAFAEEEKSRIAKLRARDTAILAELDKALTENHGPYNAALDRAIDLAIKGDSAAASAHLIGEVRTRQSIDFTAADESRALQQGIADDLTKNAVATASFSVALS